MRKIIAQRLIHMDYMLMNVKIMVILKNHLSKYWFGKMQN